MLYSLAKVGKICEKHSLSKLTNEIKYVNKNTSNNNKHV